MELQLQEQPDATLTEKVTAAVAMAGRCEVTDDATAERATDLGKGLAALARKLDETRKEYTRPLDALKKKIMGNFDAPMAALMRAANSVRSKLLVYMQAQEHIRREAARREQERLIAEAIKAATPAEQERQLEMAVAVETVAASAKAEVTRGNYGASASLRREWTFDVVDLALVPREWLVLDEARLRLAVRRKDDPVRDVPGLRIYQQESLAIR